jgi:putative heme degradation protein
MEFEKQLYWYIKQLEGLNTASTMNRVSGDLLKFYSNFSRALNLEIRMKRELLRSYDYQKERGHAFHKLYQKSLDDTLKL